jgi:hypothetical protein
MIKSRGAKGRASVTFTLDPGVGAQTAVVCGEWNDWSADADVMRRDAEGGFSVTVDLEAGRTYRFRYLPMTSGGTTTGPPTPTFPTPSAETTQLLT